MRRSVLEETRGNVEQQNPLWICEKKKLDFKCLSRFIFERHCAMEAQGSKVERKRTRITEKGVCTCIYSHTHTYMYIKCVYYGKDRSEYHVST